MIGRNPGIIRLLPVFSAVLFLAAAPPEAMKITLRRDAVLSLLSGAMPYRMEVGSGLLKETLVFSDPKELVFGEGRLTFAVRCQGSPFPLDQVLHPVVAFQRGAEGYRMVVQSLPVSIPGFGKVDLKDLVQPVDLRSLLRQALNLSGRPTLLEVKVDRIGVNRDAIDLSANLLLTPLANR